MNKNVSVNIINGVSKSTGKEYKALQLKIKTSQGIYTSNPIFPTPLEISLIEDALKSSNDDFLDFEN